MVKPLNVLFSTIKVKRLVWVRLLPEAKFQNGFVGKVIAENNSYKPIEVVKPGQPLDERKVEGLSGATFTAKGVDEMMARNFEVYYNFLQKTQLNLLNNLDRKINYIKQLL
jgi:Na+-transporting NADH:ubiquinone oxidoreductase subunit NqrC